MHKLVRDKIPEIIRKSGRTPDTQILRNDKEYLEALYQKMQEELEELKRADNLSHARDELADLQEVLSSIRKAQGLTMVSVWIARILKRFRNGGFKKRILLKQIHEGADCPMCLLVSDHKVQAQRFIYENDSFVVVAALGALGIKGYILIITKRCVPSFAHLTEAEWQDYKHLQQQVESIYAQFFRDKPFYFEHGAINEAHKTCNGVGTACVDHAHMHVLPYNAFGIMNKLKQKLPKMKILDNVDELTKQVKLQEAYIFAQQAGNKPHVFATDKNTPSQLVRRLIAEERKSPKWNWREYSGDGSFVTKPTAKLLRQAFVRFAK